HDLAGWHTELYVDARSLDGLEDRIAALPAASIDHLGMHEDGLPTLLRLVELGVKVKATGSGRIDLDPTAAIRAIMRVDPTALMVGTDLPSTRRSATRISRPSDRRWSPNRWRTCSGTTPPPSTWVTRRAPDRAAAVPSQRLSPGLA